MSGAVTSEAISGAPSVSAQTGDAAVEERNVLRPNDNKNSEQSGGQPARRRFLLLMLLLLVVSATLFLIWYFGLRHSSAPQTVVSVSGRLEGDEASVAAKTGGRIRHINVREGDQVKAGEVIAILDDEQVRAREEQAQSTLTQSEARLARAGQQIAVLQAQVEESRLGVGQARLETEGRVRQAESQVAAAEAQLAQAEAGYRQALYDAERYTNLVRTGDVSERAGKQALSAAEAQAAVVNAARKQVEAARGALAVARSTRVNPSIRSAQTTALEKQIDQARTDIEAAEAEKERARAQLEEARANRQDLQIVAPFDGTVATRTAEPGEVVSPGTPVVTVVNLGEVYMRAFVPEGEIGHVRVGQSARIYLDSNPGQPVDAYVARIDPEASFTPENTYFRNDRVRQVFGVRLQLKGAVGQAKPGMPADGEILIAGESWPSRGRTGP